MRWQTGLVVTAVLAGLALPGDARADRLDYQLNAKMPGIMAQLKAKYRTVGVLRFRVQEGTGKESFTAPICGNLIDRLETLLIVNNGSDESKALSVIHDASKTATQGKVGQWYRDKTGRRKLFDLRYPLAWGNKMVKADAFLTGKVTVTKDGKTSLALECFDSTNLELRTLTTITINTDRFVWRDLGYSLGTTTRGRSMLAGKRTSIAEQDKFVYHFVPKRRQPGGDNPPPPPPPGGVDQPQPSSIGGVSVKLIVDGTEVMDAIREAATEGDGGKWELKSPSKDAKSIVFHLQNNSDKKRAVVFRVNERNVINEQPDEPETAAKFVLLPKDEKKNTEVKIKGFIKLPEPSQDKKVKGEVIPFKVLVGPEAAKAKEDMGARAGWIEIAVFEEGETDPDTTLIAPKGMPPSKDKQARSTYLGLRSALLRSSKLKTVTELVKRDGVTVKRELIVADEAALKEPVGVEFVTFPAKHLQTLKIRVVPGESTPTPDPNAGSGS